MTNKSNPLISVIVPVYNCEQYVEYCIRSILAQSYSNLEIILVNDGSTDNSPKICEQCRLKDKRISVIHKTNGGLSSARNVGLGKVSGEYVAFIDSDDYVRADFISLLYQTGITDGSDLVICCARKVAADQNFMVSSDHLYEHCKYDREKAIKELVGMRMPIYAHSKLYKTSFAKQIQFPEGRLYEDVYYNWRMINLVGCVSYITDDPYFYRQRKGSIVNAVFKHSRMDQLFFSEDIYKDVLERGDDELLSASQARCLFAALDNFSLISDFHCSDYEYLCNAIIKYGKRIGNNEYCNRSIKMMNFMFSISPRLAHAVGAAYKRFSAFRF